MEDKDNRAPLFENLRKLINVVDELRDVGLQQYIKLPSIAVLGTQSSGKSSLLESIMGIDCLPRGDGVVTRRPLELRLVHTPFTDKPWAVFEELKNEKIFDFDKVKEKINELTDKVCGTSKDIVDVPIVMTVYSPTCPDLTLIDLPGITRVPMKGQNEKIEEITKNMAKRYCTEQRTVILCVIAANADISTSDGLQLARQWDPQGARTIGVFTKIDIMDKGTDARKMILGQEIPLNLGYVAVKGRSQHDINEKMKVARALEIEKEYFSSHPVYSQLPAGHTGTEALTDKLTKILFHHIRSELPSIYKEIIAKAKDCEDRLKDLGTPLPSTPKEKMQLLWNMINDFTENFKNTLKGKYDGRRPAKLTDEISGGAKIKNMFHQLYTDLYKKNPSEIYSDKDIELAIKYHQGDSIPGFPSLDAFMYLVGPILEKLKEPSAKLIEEVHSYLEYLASLLIGKIFSRFPGVVEDITEITYGLLREERDKTKTLIDEIIESEQNYIFTNDLGYLVTNTNFIPNAPAGGEGRLDKKVEYDPTKIFIGELRGRIDSYVNIVLRNIRDLIPKLVGNFLVTAVQSRLQYTIYNEINRKEELMNALGEPPHITAERETLMKVLGILNKAKKVLQKEFGDLTVPSKHEENGRQDSVQPDNDSSRNRTTNASVKSQYVSNTSSNNVIKEVKEVKEIKEIAPITRPEIAAEEKSRSPDHQEKEKQNGGIPLGNGLVLDNVGFNPLTGQMTGNVKPTGLPFGLADKATVNVATTVDKNMNLVSTASVQNPLNGAQAQKPVTTSVNPLAGANTKPADNSLFGGVFGAKSTKK